MFKRAEKHKCRQFCCPEKRFDLSESVFSWRPTPHCLICVRESIVSVLEVCLLSQINLIAVC